jgi:hypothetical protein
MTSRSNHLPSAIKNGSRAICVRERGPRIWIADAHRGEGKRFVVRADEKLTAFLELESTIGTAERPQDCGGHKIKFDKLSRIK